MQPFERLKVESVAVGVERRLQGLNLKVALAGGGARAFIWPGTVAHHVLRHIGRWQEISDEAVAAQQHLEAKDWDMAVTPASVGVEVHEYTDGLVLIQHFQSAQQVHLVLTPGAAGALRHYLAACAPLMQDFLDVGDAPAH